MRVSLGTTLLLAGLIRPLAVVAQGPPHVSDSIAGSVRVYETRRGDTLTSTGARFGVDVASIARANELPPDARLHAGHPLVIDNRHIVPSIDDASAVIVINVPQRMLFFFGERAVSAFPVAVGRRGWATPLGPFHVEAKEEDPVWDVPLSIQEELRRAGRPVVERVQPGAGNPLGTRWLGLSIPSIGIHGTSQPTSIYHAATHGCIRMHDDDVRVLFAGIDRGAQGRIVYEPVLLAHVGDAIYLEAHPDVYRLRGDSAGPLRESTDAAGLTDRIDWDVAARVLRERDGIARIVSHVRVPGVTP